MKTTISTDLRLSSKIRKRIKHEIHRNLGANVCDLHQIPVGTPENPNLNGCAIYTEIEGENPKAIFNDLIVWGTNYLFGMISNRRTKQKIFFLADIENPLHISENNKIIMPGADKEIIIHVK